VSKDVKLTEEEKRILADIEQYEDELRTHVLLTELRAPRGRRDRWAWGAVIAGVAVLVTGFVGNLGLMPFAGFVVLLLGVTRLSERVSFGRWRSWLHEARRNLSNPRSSHDGT